MPYTIALNGAAVPIPGVTEGSHLYLREACLWCMVTLGHLSGIEMPVTLGTDIHRNIVEWDTSLVNGQTLRASYNEEDAIEHGAMFIALRLICLHTEYIFFERSVRGDGIDYWLSSAIPDDSSLPFATSEARLEVSGILEDNATNALSKRAKAKIGQTKPSGHVFPLFISITEFGGPRAELVRYDA